MAGASSRTWSNAVGVTPISTITFNADGTASGSQGACTFSGASCSLNTMSMVVEATVVNNQLTVFGVTTQRDQGFYMSGQ